jgi:hypothetical protein
MVHSDDGGGGNETNNDDGGGGGGEPDFVIDPGQNLDLTDPDNPVVEEDGEVVRRPEPSGGDDESDFGGDSGGDVQDQTNNEDDSPNTTAVVVTENEQGEQVTVGQGTDTQEARIDAALNPDFDAAQGEEVDAFETAADTGFGDGTGPDALINGSQQETRSQENNTRNSQQTNPRLFQDAQETFIRSQQPNFQPTPSGNTRTATTSELLNQGTQENILQILREQTQPITETINRNQDIEQPDADFTPNNPLSDQTGLFDPVDFNVGQSAANTEDRVERATGNEQFAESVATAEAGGTAFVEGFRNIPSAIENVVTNPRGSAEAFVTSTSSTVDRLGERDFRLESAQDFEKQAREDALVLSALTTPLFGTGILSQFGRTVGRVNVPDTQVSGVTDNAGIFTSLKRQTGVEDVQAAKQIITRDPETGELVINQPSQTQVEKIDNRDLIETDQENLPQLSGNLRDEPGRRGAGPVDRPEEGLTRQEVEVLAEERDVGQLGVRKEGPEGGIKEARTQDQQKRIVSDAEVQPASKARRLADKTDEIVGSLGGERKGSLQVTKQDTTGRDFDQPADTTNIDQRRPSRTRNDRKSLEEVVDDFEQNRRNRADNRQDKDSDVVDLTGQSFRNIVAASQGTEQTQNPIQDFKQDQGQRPGQDQRQPQDQDRTQQPRQRQEPRPDRPDNIFNQDFDIPERPNRRRQDEEQGRRRRDRDFDIDFGRENNEPEKILGFSDEPEVSEQPEAAPSVDAILFGETGDEDKDDEEVFSGFETRRLDPGNDFDLV